MLLVMFVKMEMILDGYKQIVRFSGLDIQNAAGLGVPVFRTPAVW